MSNPWKILIKWKSDYFKNLQSKTNMKRLILFFLLLFVVVRLSSQSGTHSILPIDGVIEYLPKDSVDNSVMPEGSAKIRFNPTVNFFFRPEFTSNYKEAGLPIDTGQLNFYLRGDIGARISLPKNIDMVVNLQSYGLYTRSLGPLDPDMSLYEAYVDMKSLDRAGRMGLKIGRMSIGKYGTELLVGDDDFIKGRSFESVRYTYRNARWKSDNMWVQLYQAAPDTVNFDWNHPIFLGTFNTFMISEGFNIDVNLPYLIDQYNSGFRTSVLMPDVRLFGNSGNLRYSAEMIYQTGLTRGVVADEKLGNVNAYAMEAGLGYYTSDDKFGIDVSYYRASGDDDPTDADINSYNVLWQNEHRRFGYIDAFKGSNLQAATLHLNWRIKDELDLGVHGVYASVLEQVDRSTAVATLPSLQNLGTESTALGIGGDLYLNYYLSQQVNVQLSASLFSPGEYFTAVNGIDDMLVRVYGVLALRI